MSFKKDVLKLASGTAVAQAITILAAPVLTRLYAPEAFGEAALFVSVTGILGLVACLSYEQAVMLPEDDDEARDVVLACLLLATATAALSAVVAWAAGDVVAGWMGAPRLAAYLWLVPLTVFFQGAFNALNYWNTRSRRFALLSVSQVSGQVSSTAVNLGAGVLGHATGGFMIAAAVLGQAITAGVLAGGFRSGPAGSGLSGIRRVLRKYRRFPQYTFPSSLLNSASWQLPVFLMGALFSSTVVGFYALGFRILQMPMSLLGRSISQVFLQRAALEGASGNLKPLLKALFRRLLLAGLPPCLLLTLLGRDLFAFAFGERWAEAGVYVQILAPWAWVWFVSSPLSSLYYVLGKQREEMSIQAAIFATRLASIGIGWYFNEPRLAVLLFSVSGLATYGYLVVLLFRWAGLRAGEAFEGLLPSLRDAALLAVLLLLLKWSVSSFVVIAPTACAVTGVYVYLHRRVLLPRRTTVPGGGG